MITEKRFLKYKPLPHQKKFHDSKALERMLLAGMGSGKSMAGVAETLKFCALNPGLSALIVCLSYPVYKRTIMPAMISLLEESKIKYKYNKSDFVYTIEDMGNAKIYVGSSEIPSSLKGANCCFLYMDEFASFSKESYYQSISRVRDPKANRLGIISTTTPEFLSWVKEELIDRPDANREIIYASTYENIYLSKNYIESLESRFTEELKEMYLHGRFVNLTGKVIKPKWFEKIPLDFGDKNSAVIHYCIDSAYGKKETSDDTGILEYSIIGNDIVLWKFHNVNLEFPDLVKYIQDLVENSPSRYKNQSQIFIEPKANGISIVQYLKRETRLNVLESTPPKESKFLRVLGILPMLESGRVKLYAPEKWDVFLYQMSQFTQDETYKDEAVDCLVMCCHNFSGMSFNMADLII